MDLLWSIGRPLSRSEIISLSPESKTWKDSSIHILLNSLLKKEAIREAGFVRSGKVFSRTFKPTIQASEYYARSLLETVKKTNVSSFLSALLEDTDISSETIDELEKMIQRKKLEQKDV